MEKIRGRRSDTRFIFLSQFRGLCVGVEAGQALACTRVIPCDPYSCSLSRPQTSTAFNSCNDIEVGGKIQTICSTIFTTAFSTQDDEKKELRTKQKH